MGEAGLAARQASEKNRTACILAPGYPDVHWRARAVWVRWWNNVWCCFSCRRISTSSFLVIYSHESGESMFIPLMNKCKVTLNASFQTTGNGNKLIKHFRLSHIQSCEIASRLNASSHWAPMSTQCPFHIGLMSFHWNEVAFAMLIHPVCAQWDALKQLCCGPSVWLLSSLFFSLSHVAVSVRH